ncbi:MAG: hypothetical protein KF727_08605 [Microbacteriaceae bacterium]|nr:hypothetical protein [Microbacteriaceae bacterium]
MKYSLIVASVTALTLLASGCAAATEPSQEAVPPSIDHVHGIAADPRGDELFIATHNGIFTIAPTGKVSGPIGGYDFDAMGFTVADETIFASGHPGLQTPTELGSPNLGIIRSDDFGESWSPVAFTSIEDFHVLTAGPDRTLYGIGSSTIDLLISTDNGTEWTRGAPLAAADLATTDDGVYAATEEGLQVSTDRGTTFTLVSDAPVLYSLDARPDGTLVGAGIDGGLWSQATDGTWAKLDSLVGPVQALAAISADRTVLVDDRGIVEVTPNGSAVLSPAG